MPICPVDLTARLIRCPSVTPVEGGALKLLHAILEPAGFECIRVDRNNTPNLYARWGKKGAERSFGFNGHTDVVPTGDVAAWSVDPFGGVLRDGRIWGRGACDMKSGVAAFVAAAVDLVRAAPPEGAICLAITGDEEGPALDGTRALLDHMAAAGERMSVCLVGEPTCPETLGDMMKIGRRGSLNARITLEGQQGHVAYPHRARNPLPAMAELTHRLANHSLDEGTAHFEPSNLQIVSIDTGNEASNVIPARSTAALNIRFNDCHTGTALTAWLEAECEQVAQAHGLTCAVETRISGESFLTPPGPLSDLVAQAVHAETGMRPDLSTSGGTSDARFIKDHCPVVEFGLVGQSMHQVDESASVEEIHRLKAIYKRILSGYFA